MKRYLMLLILLGMATLLGSLLLATIGYHAVGFVFLLFVLSTSLFASRSQIIGSAIFSALIWDVFFIPPFGTLHIDAPQDIFMCIAYFATALVTGMLTSQIRSREQHLEIQKNEISLLYDVAKILAETSSVESAAKHVFSKLREAFLCDFALMRFNGDGALEFEFYDSSYWNQFYLDKSQIREIEISSFENIATLSSQPLHFFRLRTGGSLDRVVIVHKINSSLESTLEPRALVNCLKQLSMYFERIFFEEQSQNAKRLQESERLYHTILNSVSHEIKTPITTIMGSLGTLNRSEIRKNEQATSDLIADGIEATVRLNNVVNNLLDMSRLESGHLGLCPSVCDPYDLVEQSLLYIGNVNIRGRVQVKVVEKVPSLRCDFHLLQQAISNLIINAVKYSPPETPVLVNVEAVNSYVEFQIIDDGPGIPLNEQDRIFDKFYQLKNIVQGGTGLGLSLVKGIVESHQGYINCISDGKSGAKFVIGVPVHSESSTV